MALPLLRWGIHDPPERWEAAQGRAREGPGCNQLHCRRNWLLSPVESFCRQWKIEEASQPRFSTEFHRVSVCKFLSPLSEDLLWLCVYRQVRAGSSAVLHIPRAKKEGIP